jgi:hypothetical protein
MTGVAFPNTVLGSMEGSEHVFKLTSEELIEPTANTPGKATGGGKIEGDVVLEPAVVQLTMPPDAGSQATFGFVVQLKNANASIQGELQYDDHNVGEKIHVKTWDEFVITQPSANCGLLPGTSHAHMHGTGDVNGTMQEVTVEIDDCDEPGSQIPGMSSVGPDQFTIDTAGYMNGGPLIGGNIQITLFSP